MGRVDLDNGGKNLGLDEIYNREAIVGSWDGKTMIKVVFWDDFFFSGYEINPKHEFQGHKSRGQSCQGPAAVA